MKSFQIFILIIAILFGFTFADDDAPIVKTKNGQVKGYVKTLKYEDNKKVHIFEGIKYGKPPVGENRFKMPKPVDNWEGVYEATKPRNICVQPTDMYPDDELPMGKDMDEDCLYLSIYKPADESKEKKAVMFWIHGGGLESGSAFSPGYEGTYLAAIGDVIVVTFNYRLGIFGWAYAGTEDIPGNMGYHDQLLALKWVNDNIEAFGGDKNRITLFGESAGSISTGAHMISPLSKGLFQRAIMESGAPVIVYADDRETALEKLKAAGEIVNCPNDDLQKLIECIREKPAAKLNEITKPFRFSLRTFGFYYPSEMFSEEPKMLMKKGKFNKDIDLISGNMDNEGTIFTEAIFPNYLSPFIKNPQITKDQVKVMMSIIGSALQLTNYQEAQDFYLNNIADDDIDGLRLSLSNLFGDYFLVCPTTFFTEEYVKYKNETKNVYSFRMTHRPSFAGIKECTGYMGVCHATDIIMVFGYPVRLRGLLFPEEEYQESLDTMRSWANFARDGTPGKFGDFEWEKCEKGKLLNVFKWDLPKNYKMMPDYNKKICDDFWKPVVWDK